MQTGADIILTQSGSRDSLYESGALSGLTLSTEYSGDLYLTDGSQTIDESEHFNSVEVYVGVDGGTYWLGSTLGVRTELSVSGPGIDDDGNLLLKRGSKATLLFTDLDTITMSDVVFGVKDTAGRQLMQVAGVIDNATTVTVNVAATDAIKLIEGSHKFDLFEVDEYVAADGTYSDARKLASADVTVNPLNIRLGGT